MGCGSSAGENIRVLGPIRWLALAGLKPTPAELQQAARSSAENSAAATARAAAERRPPFGKVGEAPGALHWLDNNSVSSSFSVQGSLNDDDFDWPADLSVSTCSNSSFHSEDPPPWSTTPPSFRFLSGCTVPSLAHLGPSDTVHTAKRRIASKTGLHVSEVQVLSGSQVLPEHWTLLELSGEDLLVIVADMCEPDEYIVRFDRSNGTKLGIDVDHRDGESLIIEGISLGTDGLVAEWNASNPELAVRVGDRIVAANGVSKDAMRMVEECKRLGPVKVKLRRPGPGPTLVSSAAS